MTAVDNSLVSRKRLVISCKSLSGDDAALKTRVLLPSRRQVPVLRTGKKRASIFDRAKQGNFDTVVFPFITADIIKEAKSHNLEVEVGGWSLSVLVPRRLFFFNRELFRMEGGKRRRNLHFCPTNPQTIDVIRSEGKKMFRSFRDVSVFNLWPEMIPHENANARENHWCACPACRAFSASEQYRIAVNAAADVLAEINPRAFISIYDYEIPEEEEEIPLRPNVFKIIPENITFF